MKILDLRKVINLSDFYFQYEAYLKSSFEEKTADSLIAKAKTSLLRYTLPEYGLHLKMSGNLSSLETIEGLKFMEQIPIYQVIHFLDAQEQVFNKFGDRVSPASRRVYRSALKKMLDWGKSQDWWKQSIETSSIGRTPKMIICKKRVEHWHKLKPEEISLRMKQELDSFSIYLNTSRATCLANSICIRYRREILGIWGWLYRIKGFALADLSLTQLVPVVSISKPNAAAAVVALAQEYLEWMRTNIGGKESTLLITLQAFFYVAEFIHYECQKEFQQGLFKKPGT